MRIVLLWLIGAGCAHHRGQDDELMFLRATEDADRAWDARGSGGLDAIGRALASVPSGYDDHPEVLWRLARLEVARAMVARDDVAALRLFADARDDAVRCLTADASVRAGLERGGWGAALARVGMSRVPCLEWAAVAWARWMDGFGVEAAGVDAEAVSAMLDRLGGAGSVDVATWMRGLLDAGAPGAHARGVTALEQAYARGRDRDDLWVRWADLVRHGGGAAAPGRAPRTPEERAVAERLEEEDALE